MVHSVETKSYPIGKHTITTFVSRNGEEKVLN